MKNYRGVDVSTGKRGRSVSTRKIAEEESECWSENDSRVGVEVLERAIAEEE